MQKKKYISNEVKKNQKMSLFYFVCLKAARSCWVSSITSHPVDAISHHIIPFNNLLTGGNSPLNCKTKPRTAAPTTPPPETV